MERPTSPHLSIYRLPLTAKMSISHRITGVALYAGMFVLVGWMVLAAYYPGEYAKWHGYAISPVGRILMLGWTLAFYYHFCNGIRHLFWDMGKGFALPVAMRSNWLVILFTLAFTAGTWGYVYGQAGGAQ